MLSFRRKITLPLGLDFSTSAVSLVAAELSRDGFVVRHALTAPVPASEPAMVDRTIAETARALVATIGGRERRCVIAPAQSDVVTRSFRVPPNMNGAEALRAASIEADGLVPWPASERLVALDPVPGRQRDLLLSVGRNAAIERLVALAKAAGLRPVAVDAPLCAWRRAVPHDDAILDWTSDRAVLFIFGDPVGTTHAFASRLIDERLVAQLRTAFVEARRDGLADVQSIAIASDSNRHATVENGLAADGYSVRRLELGGETSPSWAFAYGLASWSIAPRGIRAA